jgi:hypothetical protein
MKLEKKYIKVVEYPKDGLMPNLNFGFADLFLSWIPVILASITLPIWYFFINRNVYYREIK